MPLIGFRLFFLLGFLLSTLQPAWANLCGDTPCPWQTVNKLPAVFSCYPQISLNRKSGQFCLEDCGSGELLCAQSVEITKTYDVFLLEFAPTSTNLWKLGYRFWHADQSITDFQITQVDGLIKKVSVTFDGLAYRLFHQDSPNHGLKLGCTQPEFCEVCWSCIEERRSGPQPFCGDGIREFGEYCDSEPGCPANCRRAPPYLCEPPPPTPIALHPLREICPDRMLPWTKIYETSAGYVSGSDIEVDANGTLYASLDGILLGAKVVQLDACGQIVWVAPYSSVFANVTLPPKLDIDECGNSYITRQTQDAMAHYTLHISKISFEGEPLGLTSFHVSASDWEGDRVHDIAVDKVRDALYVVGERGPEATSDIWLRKYNKNLELIWQRIHPSAGGPTSDLNDAGFAVAVDVPGNVYITGRLAYPEGTLDTPGKYLFAAKYNPEGTLLWANDFTTVTDPLFPNLEDRDESRGVDLEVGKDRVYVVVLQEPADGFAGSWAPKIVTQFDSENGSYLGTTSYWAAQRFQATGIDLWELGTRVYLSGYFEETTPYDAWGVQFNFSLTPLWEDPIRTLLPGDYDVYLDVTVDSNDFSHFIGWVAPVVEGSPTDQHAIVRKIASDGTTDGWSGF